MHVTHSALCFAVKAPGGSPVHAMVPFADISSVLPRDKAGGVPSPGEGPALVATLRDGRKVLIGQFAGDKAKEEALALLEHLALSPNAAAQAS